MKLTTKWLEEKNGCPSGLDWFQNQTETNPIKIIKSFIETKEHIEWANWLICRLFKKKEKIKYAIYAAEQVIKIYENKYPKDKRPRNAINAAKKYLKYPTKKNKAAAAAAAAADVAAAAAAYAAAYAAAAYAAAAYAAADAAAAAYAAAYAAAAADAAAAAAAAYAAAARTNMRIKILKYGLKLLDMTPLSADRSIG
jgi:ABC-type multidrug transport system fused ATPase/permease subunit